MLEERKLKVLDVTQSINRHKPASDVTIAGWSPSYRQFRVKTFRIQSLKPDTICNVVLKNWD